MTKKKPTVLIRTDGNHLIGMGHIFRSIAIAKQLKNLGFNIMFLAPKNKILKDKMKPYGKFLETNNNENDEILQIQKLQPEIFILDILKKFFKFKKNYFYNVCNIANFFISIDYVGKEIQFTNLSVNTLFDLKKFKTKNTIYDLKYASIRNDFLDYRKKYHLKQKVKSILIMQGGSDTLCISPKIIKSIRSLSSNVKLTIILGPNFKNTSKIIHLTKNFKNIQILHDVKNIGKVMIQHDLAITAAGNSLVELQCIDVPCIVICADKHELEFAKNLEKKI